MSTTYSGTLFTNAIIMYFAFEMHKSDANDFLVFYLSILDKSKK
jgi:hypothetical protein